MERALTGAAATTSARGAATAAPRPRGPAPRTALRAAPASLARRAAPAAPAFPASPRRRAAPPPARAAPAPDTAAAPTAGWWDAVAPNMHRAATALELVEQLEAGAREGQLVIVDIYTSWCASCKSLHPKLVKIAAANPEVRFVTINFEHAKPLCKSLGVKVLPYFIVYKGREGKVAEFTASISKIFRLHDAIKDHACRGDSCRVADDEPVPARAAYEEAELAAAAPGAPAE
jgi:thiol-disulfide isomerase/thioredoxin